MLENSSSTNAEVNLESNLLSILLITAKTIREDIIDITMILGYNFILFFLQK